MKLADLTRFGKELMQRARAFVYARSSDEWKGYFSGKLARVREFAQSNGEKAAAVGFLLGIAIVFFFKLFVVSAVVVGLVVLTIIIASDSRPDDWQP